MDTLLLHIHTIEEVVDTIISHYLSIEDILYNSFKIIGL